MANENPGPTSGAISVAQWDCIAHPEPIQVINDDSAGTTNVSALALGTGQYDLLFQIDSSATDPAMRQKFNSAAINPVDNVSYATVPVGTVNYLVRFDSTKVAFVAELPSRGDFRGNGDNGAFFLGAFDWAGTFYFGFSNYIIALKDVAQYRGFDSTSNGNLLRLDETSPELSYSTWNNGVADLVVTEGNFDGRGTAQWIFGLQSSLNLNLAKVPANSIVTSMETYELTVASPVTGAGQAGAFGAGFSFQDKVFFTRNNGDGVFEVDTTSISLTQGTYTLVRVGDSAVTSANDGMNCMNVADPFSRDCTDSETEVPHVNGACPAGSRTTPP